MTKLEKLIGLAVILAVGYFVAGLYSRWEKNDEAFARVKNWANVLGGPGNTKPEGGYYHHIFVKGDFQAGLYYALPESDPWGGAIVFSFLDDKYSETLEVRSYGPDKTPDTYDDIIVRRQSVKTGAINQAVQEKIEETASSAARGAAEGIIQGVKKELKKK